MARDPDGAPRDPDERGPKHRVWEGDNGWYDHPLTGERFVSVTTVIEKLGKEDLDMRWRPGLTAKAAIRRLPELIRATLTQECGQTNGRCSRKDTRQHDWREKCANCPCGRCVTCLVKDLTYEHYRESARHVRRGSAFHNWAEDWVLLGGDTDKVWEKFRADTHRAILRKTLREPLKGEVEELVDLIRPYTDSFLRFADDYGAEPHYWLMAEATVLNRQWMYAGTLDAQIQLNADASKKALELCERVGHANPILNYDSKTREADNSAFWFDHALQQAAYRYAEAVLLDDGAEAPLHPVNGALVVQVRPDGYAQRLVVTDEKTFNAFTGVLTAAYWLINDSNESTLVRAHPRQVLEGVTPPPPAKRARKTVAKALPAGKTMDAVDVPLPEPAQPQRQAATLASMQPHPKSPYGDDIPF